MKYVLSCVLAACTLWAGRPALAQVGPCYQLSQPADIRQVAFAPTVIEASGTSVALNGPNEAGVPAGSSVSPSDKPVVQSPTEAAPLACPAVPSAGCLPNACDESLDCPWRNYGDCCPSACECADTCEEKDSCPFTYGGWVSAGIYANAWGAKYNGPLTLREYGNGFTVNQTWFYLEKAIDNDGCGFDWGGRVDFIWGADGPDTQCFGDGGWDGDWFTSNDLNYGSALPQLYGELAYNDTSIKVGHFYTIIGYEVIPAPDNFFYSHSDILFWEPFTHMGALATHKCNDRITLHGGWVNGWDNGWLNPSGASMFLGGVSLDLAKDTTLTYATSFGTFWDNKETWAQVVSNDANDTGYIHSLVLETKLTSRLTYVLQSDFLTRRFDGAIDYPRQLDIHYRLPTRVYGVNQYLFYELNEKLLAGIRVEWLRNEEAIVIVGGGRATEAYNASELTLGLNYKPKENIIFRPEIRWDWYEGSPIPVLPFNNDSNSYQFSGGFDVIVTY